MSMLSSMTEKMRETADKVERFERRNSSWLWRDSTTITRAAVELRNAADTIDSLRNTCNDLQFENAKLTEQCKRLFDKTLELGTEYAQLRESLAESEHSESMAWDRMRKAEAENEKLRELVRDMYEALTTLDVDYCQACPRDTANGPCTRFATRGNGECSYVSDMRELGVETK